MKSFTKKIVASFLMVSIIMVISISYMNAQKTSFRDQAWRYGITGALQYNAAALGWQTLHLNDGNFHSEAGNIDRVDGTGFGAYGGIFGSYLSESWWGVDLRISYDQRNALVIDDTRTPIPSFDIRMDYLSFAPSLRIDQNYVPNLNFHFGPFVNVNLTGGYYYKHDKDQAEADDGEYDITKRNIATYGIQGGLGYDLLLAKINTKSSVHLSPFFDMSWLVNQRKSLGQPEQNSITDVWSTLSYRVGIKISMDYRKNAKDDLSFLPTSTPVRTKDVVMEMPKDNTVSTLNTTGYFPIIPYVFFEKESQLIPARYITLNKSEATNFKESDLEDFMRGELTTKETSIDQVMKSYYQVLNIYGDRMRKNSSERLILRASDPEGRDAQRSGEVIKKYLVDNFDINPSRITVEIREPFTPSGSAYTEEKSKQLIDDENRRVEFVFNNPEMLKPIKYTIRDETSIENDMFFTVDRSVAVKQWDVTITGEGKTMYFGPYFYKYARINPAELMRFLETGRYNAKVAITDLNDRKTEENFAFRLTKDTDVKNSTRYLMLFEYNSKEAIRTYENTIRKEIAPAILSNSRVIVHGHTDNIGSAEGNQNLSQERATKLK